jgi:hypothetical protein
MGSCYNCGKEITLKDEEVICDNCHKVINYPCHYCKQWFDISETKECLVCGFYICPKCGTCGEDCQKDKWQTSITKILSPEITYTTFPSLQEKINKLLSLIEEIKISHDKKECLNGVPITYAKSIIKSCIVRMFGYRVKSNEDMKEFEQRLEEVLNIQIGNTLTITQTRENGTYGQEYRDVFNYCICVGKLKKEKIKKLIDGEEIEFEVYKRTETAQCPYLDIKKLIIKFCPKCKKECQLNEENCSTCFYKKGKNIGQPFMLKLRISNKDTCQLKRGEFEKNGEIEFKK